MITKPQKAAARAAMGNRPQPDDPFAQRARSVAYWKAMAQINPHYGPVWCRAIYRNEGFRDLLMPRIRAFLNAKKAARKAEYSRQLEEEARRFAEAKALRKAGPMPLFDVHESSAA